eukprot:gene30576-52744_t
MGPAATLEFLTRVQAYTPAEKDQDHIRVIADINPKAPDRNVPGTNAGAVLAEMAGALQGAGAQVLAGVASAETLSGASATSPSTDSAAVTPPLMDSPSARGS